LVNSLKEMGYNPEVHKEEKSLQGYQGDERKQKAHIILPRNQVGRASNDVGFQRTKKGFVMHASQFDHAWRTGDKFKTLNRTYSENKIKKEVSKSSRYNIASRKVRDDGKIEIKVTIR
jgi:hypothetical protein